VSERLHLAYVTTGYPYVSHTFIQNEVLALRSIGVDIDTFAIRREPVSECRTDADRQAWETTYALRPPKLFHHLRAHVMALLTRPRLYRRAVLRAAQMGSGSLRDLARHLAYLLQAVVLWDQCRRRGIRHIHAHFANVASDVALLAARIAGPEASWSFTMHGPTEFYEVRRFRLAEKVSEARFVICISDFARSQLMTVAPPESWDRLHVVHCGVDTGRFVSRRTDDHGGPLRIVCVGRLVPEKGQALLLEAIARLRAAGLDLQITIIGDGPTHASLEAMARSLDLSDRIQFRGAVAHDEVEAELRRSDIFCLPSFAEGVPIVLMEAMAMELPVVASHVMGIPELVRDRVDGYLVRPGSVDDLTAALKELAGDERLRLNVGRAAREGVVERFELHQSARELRALYGRYLAARS